jgi:hypothetical protein
LVLPYGVTATIDANLATNVGKVGYDTTLNFVKYKDNIGVKKVASQEWIQQGGWTLTSPNGTVYTIVVDNNGVVSGV